VEPTGLEPVTPCLQSKCAASCAMAPRSLFALVGGSLALRTKPASSIHGLRCVHRVHNQCGGTVSGLLGNGTHEVSVHVCGHRDMPEQLRNDTDVSARGQHQRCGTVP
jgi:hypothetical protein